MSSSPNEQNVDATREFILDAAQDRLIRFGYHKTTMAEIAESSGMSAANLYRYFKNKKDIVAECTVRCLNDRIERLRLIVDDVATSPGEKLKRYALEIVDDTHSLAGPDSMIGELVDTITRERPDVLHAQNEILIGLIREILEAGIEAGDFKSTDVDVAARDVFAAFTIFEVPLFIGFYSREEFDRRAVGIAELIVNGLRQT